MTKAPFKISMTEFPTKFNSIFNSYLLVHYRVEIFLANASSFKRFLTVFLWSEQLCMLLDNLIPMSDQDRISPHNINTVSTEQVMRVKKNINLGILN